MSERSMEDLPYRLFGNQDVMESDNDSLQPFPFPCGSKRVRVSFLVQSKKEISIWHTLAFVFWSKTIAI